MLPTRGRDRSKEPVDDTHCGGAGDKAEGQSQHPSDQLGHNPIANHGGTEVGGDEAGEGEGGHDADQSKGQGPAAETLDLLVAVVRQTSETPAQAGSVGRGRPQQGGQRTHA